MSITDELREGGIYRPSTNTRVFFEEELLAIADRIDEQHRRGMATAQQVGYNEGEDAAMRDGWVKLPVDADGVPIRIGDVMEWPTTGETFEVVGISANTLFYIEHDFDDSAQWTAAHDKRHVQPDSWERIIGDALTVGWQNGNWNEVASAEIHERLVERCKRLAGE